MLSLSGFINSPKKGYLILAVVLLLVVSIPVTLFVANRKADNRSHANASTTLSFEFASGSATMAQPFSVNVMLDPGQNVVTIVDFALLYDKSQLILKDIVSDRKSVV